jgi:hypothetical protein
VAEAKFGALFENAKEGTVTRTTPLAEMGHNQDATELKTDITTPHQMTLSITLQVQQKCSKAMDVKFYWVKDRVEQADQFNVGWAPGDTNMDGRLFH